MPLQSEHPDGRRPAADTHAFFLILVDDRRLAGLHGQRRAAVDGHFHRILVAQRQHRLTGDVAFLLAAAGQVVHAAQRQHLRAVFGGRHMADLLAPHTYGRRFRSDIAIRVDLHLHAAIAEHAFGHDGHHVDAVMFGRHDERRRLVIRVGRGRADTGNERRRLEIERPVPVFLFRQERHQIAVFVGNLLGNDHRIGARQFAAHVSIAAAGTGFFRTYPAQHRTRIAGDDAVVLRFVGLGFRPDVGVALGLFAHDCSPLWASSAARTRSGVAGACFMWTPVA